MIKFKTPSGKWTVEIPTIQKYYEIQEWIALSDQTDIQIKLISVLSGAPEAEVRELESSEFIRIWNLAIVGPLSSLTETRFESRVMIEGVEYGFINIAKLSIGELADMDTLKAHPQVDRQLHKMMAVLYRPVVLDVVEAYSSDGFTERAETFLHKMPVSNVIAAIDFFFHITKVCLNNMMDSLVPTMTAVLTELTEEEMNAVTLRLQEDGVDYSFFLPETTSLKQTTALDLES
jgi:hypothetical protein